MENWKDIQGYEGRYQVSDLGRIKSLPRTVCHGKKGIQTITERILKPSIKQGYKCVILCINDDKAFVQVHIEVAKAFVANPDNKPFVNHKDADKLNCAADNLEWNTRQENVDHAVKMGLYAKKLTAPDVTEIRRLFGRQTMASIARNYGIDESTVKKICRRQLWRHI